MTGSNWRDTARGARFFGIDANAAPALLIFILHMSAVTFYISMGIVAFLAALPAFRLTPKQFGQILLYYMAGKTIYCGTPTWRFLRRARY